MLFSKRFQTALVRPVLWGLVFFFTVFCLPKDAAGALQPGQWEVFSRSLPINSMESDGQILWIASNGGVRRILAGGTTRLYTTLDGLEEARHSLVVPLPGGGAIAYSAKGSLSGYDPVTDRFSIWNRSMQSIGDPLHRQIHLLAQDYLLLVLERRVAIFHIPSRSFLLSLSRFGSHSLDRTPVESLTRRDSLLFLAIDSTIYVRRMSWTHLQEDRSLSDPSTWLVHRRENFPVRTLYWVGDSLYADSLRGVARVRQGQVHRILPEALVLGRDTLYEPFLGVTEIITERDTLLNAEQVTVRDTLRDTVQLMQFLAPGPDGSWYAAGENALYQIRADGEIRPLDPSPEFRIGTVHTVAVGAPGTVYAWGRDLFAYIQGAGLQYQVANPQFPANAEYDRGVKDPLKTLALDGSGNLFIGLWGLGFVRYPGSFLSGDPTLGPATLGAISGYCMDEFVPGSNWVLVRGVSAVPGLPGLFFTYWGSESAGYGLGYVDGEGRMTCLPEIGSARYSTVLLVEREPTTGHLRVFAAYESSFGGPGGIDVFLVSDPEATRALRVESPLHEIRTGRVAGPNDMALDSKGRLWAIGPVALGYWDGQADSLQMTSQIPGFEGKVLQALASDPIGGLWVGTLGDGAYRMSYPADHPDSLVATRLRTNQGLLSETVYDIAVDSVTGDIWFGHDVGLSRYRSLARTTQNFQQKGFPNPVAYPNPFRPGHHTQLVMDRIDPEAVVIFYDGGANEIRRFQGADLEGGMLRWDGRTSSGRFLGPGLYHYSVRSSRSQHRGKILVVR